MVEHFLAQGGRVVRYARGRCPVSHRTYRHVDADVADEDAIGRLFTVAGESLGGLDLLTNTRASAR